MATKWVDLNAMGIGHAGTLADPYSYIDWDTNVTTGDIYLLKGDINPPSDFDHDGQIFEIRAWDTETYGPWRIGSSLKNRAFNAQNADISDGILFVDYLKAKNIQRVYLDYSGVSTEPGFYGNILNSTIILGSNARSNAVCTLEQSILISSGYNISTFSNNITVSNTLTNYASVLSGTIYGSVTTTSELFDPPTDITEDKFFYSLRVDYGVGSLGSWAYAEKILYAERYNPITMGLIDGDITGMDFGYTIQRNYSSKVEVLKPRPSPGMYMTKLALFLEDDGGLTGSDFGKYWGHTEVYGMSPRDPRLSDLFIETPNISGFPIDPNHYGIEFDPMDPEYAWLNFKAGITENLGPASINYRFLFEYS